MAKAASKTPLRQKPAFKKLRELLKQSGQRDLLWYFRAGECVERLFPREGGRQYGKGRINEITDALGKSEIFANSLWGFRDFFWAYGRQEVRWLSNPKNTDGFQLTWTHIKCLLVVDDKIRTVFQNKCVKQKWSTDELRRMIQGSQGHKSAGGRNFVRPKTLDAGLRQMIEESEAWIRRHRKVWFTPDNPVISKDSEQESPEQLPELLGVAVTNLETMERLISEYLPRVKEMQTRFKKEAARKAKQQTIGRAKPKKKKK